MWPLIGVIVGLVLGSFIQATAERFALGRSLKGRSYCPNCQKTLAWYDLFPILSYLLLRGKCRYCKKKIPREYLITECIMGALVGLLFYVSFPQATTMLLALDWANAIHLLDLAFKVFVVGVLALVFLIDLKTGLIPDKITFTASAIAAIYWVISLIIKSWGFYQGVVNSLLGKYLLPPYSNYLWDHLILIWQPLGIALLSAVLVSGFFFSLILITKGRGMGWGDVKYVFFLGLVLSAQGTIVAIFLAFLLGSIVSLVLIAIKRKHFGQTIPFGPFLSVGALLALLWGSQIIDLYINSFRL